MNAAAWAPGPRFTVRGSRFALLGIGQFALLIALLNIGLQTLPAAKAALADAPLWGELAVLGSALCGAVCSVWSTQRHRLEPIFRSRCL